MMLRPVDDLQAFLLGTLADLATVSSMSGSISSVG